MAGKVGDSITIPDSADHDTLYPSSVSAIDSQPRSDNFPSSEEICWNDYEFPQACLNYISDILLEEDLDDKPCMIQDSLALQAAEKSFYDVLGVTYPPISSNQSAPTSTDHDNSSRATSSGGGDKDSCSVASKLADDPYWNSDHIVPQQVHSLERTLSVPDLRGEMHPGVQFGVPMSNVNESISITYNMSSPLIGGQSWSPQIDNMAALMYNRENSERSHMSYDQSRGRKNYHNNEYCGYLEEGRRNKQSVISTEESEQLDILDKSFLIKVENKVSLPCPLFDVSRNEASKKLQRNEACTMRMRRLVNCNKKVDLWALLMDCAQAVGSGDQRTAKVRLQQIRQHSTPFGDGHERMAHYFANGLEARLSGSGHLSFGPSARHPTSAVDILKAYQLYVSICPFRKMTNTLVSRTIARAAEKTTKLHVIDFGISYGFQWPCFLNRLSVRPGGPPHVRITGIDLPQPGFRPAERVEETGRRLKRLAKTVNIPLEYNAIAQRWETIRYEDLKIDRDEVIAVVCVNRLRNLPDDTVVQNSPRDAVLKLIRQINPDVFMHGIVNGSLNAPFFVTRFREALFHYSALFDMFDATAAREDEERLLFEREMIGKDAINVIACEGLERVERPETYKQWQGRNSRMGFSQIPLPQDVVKRATKIKFEYHRDFLVDADADWVLLGWKGRIVHAISAWKPLQD